MPAALEAISKARPVLGGDPTQTWETNWIMESTRTK
jgi:hypothetical protein